MKKLSVGIGLLVCLGQLTAQEPLPQERAQRAAKLVAAEAARLTDAQIKTEVDTEKPFGLRKGERAVLVIPDKQLTAERVGKAGKEVVPVGQLWLRGITLSVDGNPVSSDKLRLVKVKGQDQEVELALLLLGVRQAAAGKLELLVYAREKEPLLVVALEAADHKQEQPIELEGKGEGGKGELLLHLAGKYQGKLPVAAQAP